jgi:uncharacterized membrane protein
VCQTIVVEAPLEECFAAATGFEDYPDWAGAIQGFNILERTPCGLGQLVEWEMGMFGITTKNKMKYEYELPSASSGRAVMKWHVTEGGIKELVGRYEFISMGPSSTKMVYSLFVEPGFPLPEMVKRATNRAVAKAALQDLKKYTERVRAKRKQDEEGNAEESVLSFSEERELFDLGYL